MPSPSRTPHNNAPDAASGTRWTISGSRPPAGGGGSAPRTARQLAQATIASSYSRPHSGQYFTTARPEATATGRPSAAGSGGRGGDVLAQELRGGRDAVRARRERHAHPVD